jgi:hypothetical protein
VNGRQSAAPGFCCGFVILFAAASVTKQQITNHLIFRKFGRFFRQAKVLVTNFLEYVAGTLHICRHRNLTSRNFLSRCGKTFDEGISGGWNPGMQAK